MAIETIILREEDFQADKPWVLFDALSKFSSRCMAEGGYDPVELPEEVIMNSQVGAVHNEIGANGVAGYINNWICSRYADRDYLYRIKELADRGFSVIGATDQQAIFRRIWANFEQRKEYFLEAYRSPGLPKDEQTSALQDEWFALPVDLFEAKRISWIRSLPNLQVLDQVHYEPAMQRLFELNPNREAKLAEFRAAQEAELEHIRRVQAAQAKAWEQIQLNLGRGKVRKMLSRLLGIRT